MAARRPSGPSARYSAAGSRPCMHQQPAHAPLSPNNFTKAPQCSRVSGGEAPMVRGGCPGAGNRGGGLRGATGRNGELAASRSGLPGARRRRGGRARPTPREGLWCPDPRAHAQPPLTGGSSASSAPSASGSSARASSAVHRHREVRRATAPARRAADRAHRARRATRLPAGSSSVVARSSGAARAPGRRTTRCSFIGGPSGLRAPMLAGWTIRRKRLMGRLAIRPPPRVSPHPMSSKNPSPALPYNKACLRGSGS